MAKKIRIAINGFGRIGRGAFRAALERKNIEVVGINDLQQPSALAHLLTYDSVYGRFRSAVKSDISSITVGKTKIPVYAEKDPSKLPWKKLGVDLVLECTGFFTDDSASLHIKAGAKRVIISAPAKSKTNSIKTFVQGVNTEKGEFKKEVVISNASCTTNSLAPVMEVINRVFGIKKAVMTTVHAYTADQTLVDGPHKDLRRARSAAINIIPTTTGAARAVTETIPELKGMFDGTALRVPVPVGSISDITMVLSEKTTIEKVHAVLNKESMSKRYKGIIECTNDPIVSTDIIKNPYSSIVDLSLTKLIDGDLLKLFVWYDNEWGYSMRLIDMAETITSEK